MASECSVGGSGLLGEVLLGVPDLLVVLGSILLLLLQDLLVLLVLGVDHLGLDLVLLDLDLLLAASFHEHRVVLLVEGQHDYLLLSLNSLVDSLLLLFREDRSAIGVDELLGCFEDLFFLLLGLSHLLE